MWTFSCAREMQHHDTNDEDQDDETGEYNDHNTREI
jgi:hypothetical protein